MIPASHNCDSMSARGICRNTVYVGLGLGLTVGLPVN
jgi:hypothetical protein